MGFQQNRSAERRLGVSGSIFPGAETGLGAPVAQFARFAEISK